MPEPIDPSGLPRHVGIIMDGNGRWAEQRGKHRSAGHREGLKAAKRIVQAASDLGIRYLSLFVFSTENWKRAGREVTYLMVLIRKHLRNEYDFYRENHIRVVHSGDLSRLPPEVVKEVESAVQDTAGYPGLTVNLAINYGGRDEIVRAVNRLLFRNGKPDPTADPVTEEALRRSLDHPGFPDPDLVIRTGGEYRISNFLIWETAYAELDFSSKMWPDWDRQDLEESIRRYQTRERRYGGVK